MTTPPLDPLSLLREKIDEFVRDRDWAKFHSPKNLTMALTVEAAELMEVFQWMDGRDGMETLSDKQRQAVEHEVADVFIYLLRFCSVTGIDPLAAAEKKLRHNAEKYPAELVRGKSGKYTEY
jgi:NTP pyrophosphatase (non-canonical NTP hydrolase)